MLTKGNGAKQLYRNDSSKEKKNSEKKRANEQEKESTRNRMNYSERGMLKARLGLATGKPIAN